MYRSPRPRSVFTFAVPLWKRSSYEPPRLISQDEAAHRLAVSRTSVWRLLTAGELSAVRIGSRTLVVADSIEEFISRQTRTEPSR